MNKDINEYIEQLLIAPDTQIDKSITERLKKLPEMSKDEMKTEVMHCIDDCVYGSLANQFGLHTLHILHEVYLDGSLEDFTDENCPWRKTR